MCSHADYVTQTASIVCFLLKHHSVDLLTPKTSKFEQHDLHLLRTRILCAHQYSQQNLSMIPLCQALHDSIQM